MTDKDKLIGPGRWIPACPSPKFLVPNAGKKYDGDKAPVVRGCFNYFPRALKAVAMVSKFGAEKYEVTYEQQNWRDVVDGKLRYTDADGRHLLDEAIDGPYDLESKILHAAHHAWDALARLEKMLEEGVELYEKDNN